MLAHSRIAKHSAKMHFVLCLHTCWKKIEVQIVFACSKGFKAFSLKCLFDFYSLGTVDKNYLMCLILIFGVKRKSFLISLIIGNKWDFIERLSNTVLHTYVLLCLTSISRPLNMISSKTVLHTIYSTTHCHFVPQKSRQEKSAASR